VDPALAIASRLGLALLFGWAATHKLRDGARFRAALADYGLLPARWVHAGARTLTAGETCIAAALCVPALSRVAAGVAAIMLMVYAVAIAVNLLRGRRDIDCGCGAGAAQPLRFALILRNAILATTAAAAALPATARPMSWIDGLTIGGGVAAAAALYAAVDALLANAPAVAALARHHADIAGGHLHAPEGSHA
jgi:hypothetical protein